MPRTKTSKRNSGTRTGRAYPPAAMVATPNVQNPRSVVRGTYAVINPSSPEKKALDTVGTSLFWTGSAAAPTAKVMAPVPVGIHTECFLSRLSLIGQGTDLNQRIGRTVVNKSLLLRFHIQIPPNQDVAGTIDIPNLTGERNNTYPAFPVRCMVIWDAQPNGVMIDASTISTILQPLPAGDIVDSNLQIIIGGGPYTTPFSPMNLSNRQRFTTLWDREYFLSEQGAPNIFCNEWISLGDRQSIFQDNNPTASGSSITHGCLYFMAMSNNSLYGTTQSFGATESINVPLISFWARLRFTDP